MDLQDKIFVAGHNGLVGSAIVRTLQAKGYSNIISRSSSELDLTNQQAVNEFFSREKPDHVVLAAAKVGGIHANNTYPADFIYINLMIESNVIHAAWQNGVKRLLFLGSSCIYPREASQPMHESELLKGYLEPTNEPYAIAKIAGIKLCESYNRQHGTDFRSVMPTNLYGPGDNFHPENSHVIPALIRRFHEAKLSNAETVTIWGTGKARREFLHVDDMAAACVLVLELDKQTYHDAVLPTRSHINIGTGDEVTIAELAHIIADASDYKGEIVFDTSKPDGAPRKLLDVSLARSLGFIPAISLQDGIATTFKWFTKHYADLAGN